MHSYKNPYLQGKPEGCTRSSTGLCVDCPMYIAMPVDVEDPVSGKVVQAGSVVQCVDVWKLMGSWDSGRQTQRLHAGINQAQNQADKRQEQVFRAIAWAANVDAGNEQLGVERPERLINANGQD